MTVSNGLLKVLLIVGVIIHLAVVIAGVVLHELIFMVATLNIVVASIIIVYWVNKQLRIKQHYFERREMIVLLFETVLIMICVYQFIFESQSIWIKLIQYAGFVFHTVALVLLIIFALTFKMKRLI